MNVIAIFLVISVFCVCKFTANNLLALALNLAPSCTGVLLKADVDSGINSSVIIEELLLGNAILIPYPCLLFLVFRC